MAKTTDAAGRADTSPPMTPDGRYIVVRGRLWRASNPDIPSTRRLALVNELMDARRAVARAKRSGDRFAEGAAYSAVEAGKVALGERGAPWWSDGAPDLNGHMVKNANYAAGYERFSKGRAAV